MDPRLPSGSDISPPRRASQKELGAPELSENPDSAGQPGPQIHQATPLRISTIAQILQRRACCDQTQHALPWSVSNPHLILSLNPQVGAQMQPQHCPPFLNVLPSELQAGPPLAAPQPPHAQQLLLTPSLPQGSCWLNLRPVGPAPQSRSDFPTGLWCRPYLAPASVPVLPEPPFGWCRCPPRPPVCQPSSSNMASAQQLTEQLRLTESAASSEEEQQINKTPVKDELQSSSTEDETPEVSPGSPLPLDDETLAELAFAEYTTIMDSLSLKPEEDVWGKVNEPDEGREELERDNSSILEYLEELCSDEDFVKEVESTLNTDFFDSFLPEDLDAIDILPLRELQEEQPLEEILQQHLNPPPADSNSATPVSEETSQRTSHVKAGARSPALDPLSLQTESDPNHEAPPSTSYQTGSKEESSTSSPVPPKKHKQKRRNTVDATSSVYDNRSLLMDKLCRDPSLTFDSEARDHVMFPTAEKPEEASESPANLADEQPAQTSQKLQEEAPPEDPAASEASTTSGVSGSSDDPQAKAAKDPAPSFGANSLTVSSPQSTRPQESLPPLPEEQFIPKDINPESSCLEDCSVPVPGNSSPRLCDSSVLVPEKQKVESPEGPQVPQEAACLRVSSELTPGELGETRNRPETDLGEDVGKQLAVEEEERAIQKAPERKEENKEETSVKGTLNTQLTPERDQERRLSGSKGEESSAVAANAAEQFQETGEKGDEKLTGERLKLVVERGEECEAKNPNMSTENGAENALLAKLAQEEKELGERKVKRKQKGLQGYSFVRRQTRSTTAEEKVQLTPPRGKVKHPEMDRGEMKCSPKRELQEEVTYEPPSLSISSPKKRRSLGVKTDAGSANCSLKESPEKGPLDDWTHVETCEENRDTSPALSPGKRVDRRAERGKMGECGEVEETWDFYSLRSQNVSKRTVNKKEATHHPPDAKPSPDQTGGRHEEAERPGLVMQSPMKRHQRGHRASEETETTMSETHPTDSSPKKKGRWKRAEVNSERDKEKLDDKNKDEAATSVFKPNLPSTGRTIKDKRISNFGGKSSTMETRSSRKQADIACRRQTRLLVKLPTKYKNFIMCKTMRHKWSLDKRKEEAGKGKTSRGRRN